MLAVKRMSFTGQVWWFRPAIPGRRVTIQGQLDQHSETVSKTGKQTKKNII
jgi:hypothetical protein